MSQSEKMLKPEVLPSMSEAEFVEALAQLTVRFGANLQPDRKSVV